MLLPIISGELPPPPEEEEPKPALTTQPYYDDPYGFGQTQPSPEEQKKKEEAKQKKLDELKKYEDDIKLVDPLKQAILKEILNSIQIDHAKGAYVKGRWECYAASYLILYSDRRATSLVLDCFLRIPQTNETKALIPKLVAGLMDARSNKGHWETTQENNWAVQAMNTYFKVYEAKEPDFTAKVWIDQAFGGSFTFKGRSTEQTLLQIPMKDLITVTQQNARKRKLEDEQEPGSEKKEKGKEKKKESITHGADLLMTKDGMGRLYYRVGLKYSPKEVWQPASDRGFILSRTYEYVNSPGEVKTMGTTEKKNCCC